MTQNLAHSFAKILNFGSFESFALDEFHNGIAIKLADIVLGKYFIYLRTPQNALYPCVIYNALISHRAHIARQKPIIHFTKCADLDALMQGNGAKARIMTSNAFSYAVGSSERVSAKIFYDAKLPFCAKCVENYKRFFEAFDEREIWQKMFQNELFSAIESQSLRVVGYSTKQADNHFYLARG
ncbi:hypothetical protein ACWIUD_08260 [Helicobacter sp. 23-1044]